MQSMVASGESDHLVPERVWQEFAKGLAEPRPERMFEVLERCGLRARLLPEIRQLPKIFSGSLPVRFAVLCWPLQEADVKALCDRLKVPNEERELALLACRCRDLLNASKPGEFLNLFKRSDAFRRPERFAAFLDAARLAQSGFDALKIERALEAAAAVDAGAIARRAAAPAEIPALLDRAREQAIATAL
jgi:tRNA nucleotidyltransferase (CCA-adding enzyme)